MPTVERGYVFTTVHTSLPFRLHGWRYLSAPLPQNRLTQPHFRVWWLPLRVQFGIPRMERRVIHAEPGPLAPTASHGWTVHRSPWSLTAGTSGPPSRTCTHRCQSAATGCEASSSPASPWWPQPRRRRETGEEPRKSHEAERTLGLLTEGTQRGRRAPDQKGCVTATIHPLALWGSMLLPSSSLTAKGETILWEFWIKQWPLHYHSDSWKMSHPLQTNIFSFFIGKP